MDRALKFTNVHISNYKLTATLLLTFTGTVLSPWGKDQEVPVIKPFSLQHVWKPLVINRGIKKGGVRKREKFAGNSLDFPVSFSPPYC